MRKIMSKEKMLAVKEMLKSGAKELHDIKFEIKSAMKNGKICSAPYWNYQNKLIQMQRVWRHKHVAYCLLKGRSLEQIEIRCAEDNKLDLSLVEKFKAEFSNANN